MQSLKILTKNAQLSYKSIEIVVNLELVSAAESPNILRDFSICACQLLLNLFWREIKDQDEHIFHLILL